MNKSAQQLLAELPVRMADGGEATEILSAGRRRAAESGNEADWLNNVAQAANKWLSNPGTAAEAYDAMVKSGISVKDLVDSGISRDVISSALQVKTPEEQKNVNQVALNSMTATLSQNPTLATEIGSRGAQVIYSQARQYVANLQQDGLTEAERDQLQRIASAQGWGFGDIRAAGLDPMLLFGTAPTKPKVPAPPTGTGGIPPGVLPPGVLPPVYGPITPQPDIYAPGQPALDTAFRESAPRTAIPGMPGAYEYTPAAKLRPATGAGYSWTPPVVTSRPRSLLSPTLLSYVSPSQQFAQARATQDQALLGAFRESGLPQNASNFNTWRNRLRSGEFGTGAAFDPTAFQSAFGSWASTQAPGTTAQGSAPGSVGTGVTGYSEIASGLQPIDLRRLPTATFAHGGEVSSARRMLEQVKKPEGFAEGGMPTTGPEQTESRSLLDRLGRFISLDTPQDMSLGETAADIGMGFLPGVGTAQGARDFERARRDEDILGMALSAASMIPVAGGAVRAARSIGKASKAVDVLPILERQVNLERFMEGSNAPPVLYTGTSKDVDFDKMKIPRNGAWFTASPESASRYAVENDSRGLQHVPGTYSFTEVNTSSRVLPVHLSAKSPYIVTDAKAFNDELYALAGDNYRRGQGMVFDKLRAQGYDSVHFVDPKGKEDVWVALESPTQVKSAVGNRGTFDPTSPVLTKKDGGLVKGYNKGGEASSADMLAQQMLAIGNRPSTPSQGSAPVRTEARSMLERLLGSGKRQLQSDVVEPLVGAGEAALTMGTAIPSSIPAGLRGLYEAATTPGDLQTRLRAGADIVPAQTATTTYLPRTQSGREALEQLSMLGAPSEAIGRQTLESTGSPLLATAAETFLDPLELLGPGAKVAGATLPLVAGAVKRADEVAAAASESSRMLDELTPETGAVTRPVEPLSDAGRMLAEMDNIQTPPVESTIRPTITEEIGDRRRVGTTGRYVGAPEGINTPQKLAALTRSISNLTKEGEFGRFWYERSGRQILDITGNNAEDADKLVQAIAITSPNTPVGANFDYALQAYYQWKNGQPIKTGMYTTAMSNKLQRMFDGEEWAGRKTNNFYNNLMREIDPSKAQGVTTDIWMMRAFGFDKEAPTDAQYSFVENETKRIAKNLNWEPQQVQAAIWVALKSRMENPDVKRAVEEKSFENGWITYNDEGERVVIDQNKHAASWLEKALQHTPTEADREAAKFDYADAAANNLAQISWESIPSRTSGHIPEIFNAPPEVVQDYHVQMSKAFLDDGGSDMIAKELGILSPGDFEAPGYFEQRVSPGTQTNITAPRQYGVTRRVDAIKKQAAEEGWPKEQRDAAIRAATYATDPSAREAMYAYAAARGILLKQDGVGMHRPAFVSGLSRPKANGVEVNIRRPLTARETAEIARLVAAEAGHTEYNPIGSSSGVRFINFDYLGTPNLDFQKVVNRALEKMKFDNDEAVDAKLFGADTGYLSNNWKENFNGEGYLDAGELARRPDLQRKVRDLVTRLSPRVSAVEEEFANRYNWTRNRQLNSTYEAQQEVVPVSGSLPQAAENAATPEVTSTPVRPFKRGGAVERVTNDNRNYF